jgi:hypothetical protein
MLKQSVPFPPQIRLISHGEIFEVCLILRVIFFMQMVLLKKMPSGQAVFALGGASSFDFASY